jgi:hypothetical protein
VTRLKFISGREASTASGGAKDHLVVSTWFLRGPRGSDTLARVLQRGLLESADSSIPREKLEESSKSCFYIPHLIQAFYIVYLFSKYLKHCFSIVVFLVLFSYC